MAIIVSHMDGAMRAEHRNLTDGKLDQGTFDKIFQSKQDKFREKMNKDIKKLMPAKAQDELKKKTAGLGNRQISSKSIKPASFFRMRIEIIIIEYFDI